MSSSDEASPESRLQRKLWKGFPIYEYVGLEVESTRDGIYRCFVPMRESNKNHIATIHAAIQWAASEVLGGMVMMSVLEDRPVFGVVKKVTIEFKRPARSGISAEALFDDGAAERVRADFEGEGEAIFSIHAVVRDDRGVEVASADAEYLARRPRGE